jgi:hypothetical protein
MCHTSEKFLVETRNPDIHRPKLLLENNVDIFAIFGGVREAARIPQPRGFLDRRYRPRRRSRFGNGAIDLIPDKFVRFVVENYI